MAPVTSAAEPQVAAAVVAVLAGDSNAYALIVEQFQASIMTVAMMLLKNRSAAEELTQDVFVRAYQRLSTFDSSRPMKPWLMKIAYRLAQDVGRQRTIEARRRESIAQNLSIAQTKEQNAVGSSNLSSASSPLQQLMADEQSRLLWQAMEVLPLSERAAAIFYYREGLSVEQIATTMGVSAGSIKTSLFRARDHLRTALQPMKDEGRAS